jgi:hypothetical protein
MSGSEGLRTEFATGEGQPVTPETKAKLAKTQIASTPTALCRRVRIAS